MYKLVKWAYEIGQNQERQRIKIEISKIRNEINQKYRVDNFEIRDSKMTDAKRSSIQKDMEINSKVMQILDQLTNNRGHWIEENTSPIDGRN